MVMRLRFTMRRPSALRAARVSLLLCVGVAWLWSYDATPAVVHQRPGRASCLVAYRGRLLLETAGRNDTPAWPGLRRLAAVRLINQPSETLYLDDPGLRPG